MEIDPRLTLDWARPWLAPLRVWGELVSQRLVSGHALAQALNLPGAPRQFVPHTALQSGEAYEGFIARTGQVPTRDNLHDLFNGLVWHWQPTLKARLNALQSQAIAAHGIGAVRGPLRDALTLFDEFGATLQAPDTLLQALRVRDWQSLFVTHRALWQQARLHIVGHALLEQLARAPRKGLTAHVVLVDPLTLAASDWQRKPFFPLPVMGVPLWCEASSDPRFYDDAQVFRALPIKPRASCS